jgi:hypothetical protein
MISASEAVRSNEAEDIADMVDKLRYALNDIHYPQSQIGPLVEKIISSMILAPHAVN